MMHGMSDLQAALTEAMELMNKPRFHSTLIERAGVDLDRALFPLLTRIGAVARIGVVELAAQANLNHSTISRQLAKLEERGLITRARSPSDQRVMEASVTRAGRRMLAVLGETRGRGLAEITADWSERDIATLTRLLTKLTTSIRAYTEANAWARSGVRGDRAQ